MISNKNTQTSAELAFNKFYLLEDTEVVEVTADTDLIQQEEKLIKQDFVGKKSIETIFSNLPLYPDCGCGNPNLFETKIKSNGSFVFVGAFCSHKTAMAAHNRALVKEQSKLIK